MKALVQKVIGNDDAVVAATDAGRAKWIEKLANLTGLPAAFVYKRRTGEKTAITGVNADVKGKHVVLYDDMVRSGSSMMQAADAYHQAGASKVTAIFSHGVLPQDAAAKLVQSGKFDAIHTTDSHPHASLAAKHGIQVHAIAGLFADRLI